MTKAQRERARRAAAVIAAAALWQRSEPRPVEDAGDERCRGLRRWRGDGEAPTKAQDNPD